MSTIPQNVREAAAELKAKGILNPENNRTEFEGAEDIFVKHLLPEGTTMDTVKTVQSALIDYSAAQTLAHGELSQEAMIKDKELTRTTAKTTIGYSSVESSYTRRRSGTADGRTWEKFGVASTDLVIGVGRKAAPYKSVVSYLGEEAQKVFSN